MRLISYIIRMEMDFLVGPNVAHRFAYISDMEALVPTYGAL